MCQSPIRIIKAGMLIEEYPLTYREILAMVDGWPLHYVTIEYRPPRRIGGAWVRSSAKGRHLVEATAIGNVRNNCIPNPKPSLFRALMIRIGFSGPLYHSNNKEPTQWYP